MTVWKVLLISLQRVIYRGQILGERQAKHRLYFVKPSRQESRGLPRRPSYTEVEPDESYKSGVRVCEMSLDVGNCGQNKACLSLSEMAGENHRLT